MNPDPVRCDFTAMRLRMTAAIGSGGIAKRRTSMLFDTYLEGAPGHAGRPLLLQPASKPRRLTCILPIVPPFQQGPRLRDPLTKRVDHTVNGEISEGETLGGGRVSYLTDGLGSMTATVRQSAKEWPGVSMGECAWASNTAKMPLKE